jgi:replicative DNA helicase
MALTAAMAGTLVLYCSLEMSKRAIFHRLVCTAGRIDQHRWRAGYLTLEERARISQVVSKLATLPLHIADSGIGTVAGIRSALQRLAPAKPGLVVVDYVGLMESGDKRENRNQEVSVLSRRFKLLAQSLNCPVLILSQLNRQTEARAGGRPQLADLRDSGALEQDADVVLMLYREEMYKPDREDLRGLAEMIVAKQRNGPTGTVELAWLSRFGRFESRAEDLGDEPAQERREWSA